MWFAKEPTLKFMWICSLFKETQTYRNTALIYNLETHTHIYTDTQILWNLKWEELNNKIHQKRRLP